MADLDQWSYSHPYDDFAADIDVILNAVEGPKLEDEEFEAMFLEFYGPYPKKVAPEAAKKALRAIIRKRGPEVMQTIGVALKAQCDEWRRLKTERKFLPNPATWLNGGHFENELVAVKAKSNHGGLL